MKKSTKIVLILALFAALIGFIVWQTRLLHVVDRVPSPDGQYVATVLELEEESPRHKEKVPTVCVEFNWPFSGGSSGCLSSTYDGLYWSPDSTMYLLEMTPVDAHGISLDLSNLTTNSAVILSNTLLSQLCQTPLADYGFPLNERERPDIDLSFLEWAADSSAIRLRYAFTDTSGIKRSGSFWFHLVWDDWALDKSAGGITDIVEDG